MRDVHFDDEFMRDFVEASRQWHWATWTRNAPEENATARRLIEQALENTADQTDTPDGRKPQDEE